MSEQVEKKSDCDCSCCGCSCNKANISALLKHLADFFDKK